MKMSDQRYPLFWLLIAVHHALATAFLMNETPVQLSDPKAPGRTLKFYYLQLACFIVYTPLMNKSKQAHFAVAHSPQIMQECNRDLPENQSS